MRALKAGVMRLAAAVTGQADTRAAVAKLRSRLDTATTTNREAIQHLKTTTHDVRDRILQLERRTAEDRDAILEAIKELRHDQQTMRTELASLSRLAQRTYLGLIDNEPLDESSFDRAALAAHIRRAVADAPMRADPFPHLVIPDLVPEHFYRQLLRAIPAPTFWRRTGYQRENWHILEDVGSRLSETTWRFMHREIASIDLTPLLLDRFSDVIAAYWRETLGLDPSRLAGHYLCEDGRLLLRRPGYELGPHLDPTNAILTVLFFLAEPGAPDTYGVDLYASGALPARRDGIMHPERHGIKVEHATTVPFRPNTAVVFVTPQSVHGAKLPPDVDERFERISYQFLVCLDDKARRMVRKHTGAEPAGVAERY